MPVLIARQIGKTAIVSCAKPHEGRATAPFLIALPGYALPLSRGKPKLHTCSCEHPELALSCGHVGIGRGPIENPRCGTLSANQRRLRGGGQDSVNPLWSRASDPCSLLRLCPVKDRVLSPSVHAQFTGPKQRFRHTEVRAVEKPLLESSCGWWPGAEWRFRRKALIGRSVSLPT